VNEPLVIIMHDACHISKQYINILINMKNTPITLESSLGGFW